MKLTKLIVLGASLFAGLAAHAQQANVRPDAAKGQATAAICAGCHGADGNSLAPTFPKIASQHY
ncbi:MAG TPA: c-type cytochrome, partial [Burkholderiaceae bacterium]|nr:c-type cytochrome [Burkholderiaceae bacterium]